MGDFSWYLDVFADKHGFGPRIRTGLRRRLDRRLNMPLYDTDISAVAPRINNPPPLVVVHDPDDPDSPYAMSEEIVGAWSGASLVTTRGLGRLAHYRIMRHRPAIQAAVISSAVHPADPTNRLSGNGLRYGTRERVQPAPPPAHDRAGDVAADETQ
jgi:hypothetical protein